MKEQKITVLLPVEVTVGREGVVSFKLPENSDIMTAIRNEQYFDDWIRAVSYRQIKPVDSDGTYNILGKDVRLSLLPNRSAKYAELIQQHLQKLLTAARNWTPGMKTELK